LRFSTAFTVGAWLRNDHIDSAFNCFLGKDYTTAFAIGIDSGGSEDCPAPAVNRPMLLYVANQRLEFSPGPSFDCGTSTWVHVAVTFDHAAGQARLYVNGALAASRSVSATPGSTGYPLGIGRDGRNGDSFNGLIDDLKLFDRELSAAEIQTLYHGAGTAPPVSSPGLQAWVIPAAAHAAGVGGTQWSTDVVLHNAGDSTATTNLYFLRSAADNHATAGRQILLAPHASRRLPDIVLAEFGQSSASGGILVGADTPLTVASRTFNSTPAGTYGQFTPGAASDQALGVGEDGLLVQLAFSVDAAQGFRTNIGATSVSDRPTMISVDLFAGGGDLLGTRSLTLQPFGYLQLTDVYRGIAGQTMSDGFALLRSSSPGARYFAYASVIDNRTGDAIYVPAVWTRSPAVSIGHWPR
jgi:hypothetical protein